MMNEKFAQAKTAFDIVWQSHDNSEIFLALRKIELLYDFQSIKDINQQINNEFVLK